MSRIYFDHAASTPVDPRVLRAMKPYFSAEFGNPGSLHSFGQKAIAALDASREKIGKIIGARHFRDIAFTASATEANNLALRGTVGAYRKMHPNISMPRVIVSSIEHESILETARALEEEGAEVIYVPVDKEGVVNMDTLKEALNDRTAIVSIMYANNEVGTIQPLAEIKNSIDNFKKQKGTGVYPIFHTDAAQAFEFLDCDVRVLGVDMMTLSAHKMCGPKGAGALYMRHEIIVIDPQMTGGGQEFGVRSGTENVPAIVGFAKAAELAHDFRAKELKRVNELRAALLKDIRAMVPDAQVNGPIVAPCAPHILNIYFPGRAAQDLLIRFDRQGLAVSSGSACRSRATEASYVIEALGYSKERAEASIRFSLGRTTKKSTVKAAIKMMARAGLQKRK